MLRRWMHWGCIATSAVVYLVAVSTAAPVAKDEAVISGTNTDDKPLVRTKRADEIIFNGQQEADGVRIKKSDDTPKSDDAGKSISDMDSGKKTTESSKDAAAVDAKEETETGAQEFNQKETEQDEAYDSTESEKQSTYDSSEDGERVGGRVWDEEDDDGSEQRRRRRAATSSAVESMQTVGRQERSVGKPVVAMVAENMVSTAVSKSGGGARLQRAKRELDADAIRELIESRQQAPSNDERPLYDYNDYGTTADEYAVDQNPDDIVVEAGESAPGGIEKGLYVRGDNVDEYFTDDDRRPKRRDDEDEQEAEEEEEEEEEEEAYEEAERELLAERAAEEMRMALITYLSGGPSQERGREYRRSSRDRYGQDDDADDDENSYAEDEDNEGEEVEDDGESEEIDENDDRLERGPFLPNEGPEIMAAKPSSIEQKRFTYPYTYEPYGGRWGALVPGAKRSDRDPYDRLYRLAEALSRPAAIGHEEYNK